MSPRMGSSPRVRGARLCDYTLVILVGIIPACAGSTTLRLHPRDTRRDHPRVCGEHSAWASRSSPAWGSSPRVRGAPSSSTPRARTAGIIPACAGSTSRRRARRCACRDHPRVCGEHLMYRLQDIHREGSSPRVRGARSRSMVWGSRLGIIPACAGSTTDRKDRPCLTKDHPRVCGEHKLERDHGALFLGSSPRVRGALGVDRPGVRGVGIIPACAGSTRSRRGRSGRLRDHPRVCGEHRRCDGLADCRRGSSPRVRGARSSWRVRDSHAGIIPACAGSTAMAPLANVAR